MTCISAESAAAMPGKLVEKADSQAPFTESKSLEVELKSSSFQEPSGFLMLTVTGEDYHTFFIFSGRPRIKNKMVAFIK